MLHLRTCSQNPDKAVASCDVPQELTDEQIDAIQEGADGDEDADDVSGRPSARPPASPCHVCCAALQPVPTSCNHTYDCSRELQALVACARGCSGLTTLACRVHPQARLLEERARRRRIPAAWQLISDNVMTHRKRKVQDEDDVMICNCKPHWRGGDGCGPDCINRMLCVECVAVSGRRSHDLSYRPSKSPQQARQPRLQLLNDGPRRRLGGRDQRLCWGRRRHSSARVLQPRLEKQTTVTRQGLG